MHQVSLRQFNISPSVSCRERESVLSGPVLVSPIPPLRPLRLSESVKEAGRHGYNQRCHVTLPCRHLSLSSFSGSVAFLLGGVKNVAFVLLCFTLIHM